LAIAFILPVSRPNQVKIRLVSEKRIRLRRMAFTVSVDIKQKNIHHKDTKYTKVGRQRVIGSQVAVIEDLKANNFVF